MNDDATRELIRKLIWEILDLIAKIDEDTLEEWIYDRYPHGVGLFD